MSPRTFGVAAILGGLLWAPPDLLTNAWPAERGSGADHEIVDLSLYATYVVMSLVAALLLAYAVAGVKRSLPAGRLGAASAVLLWTGFSLVALNSALALALALRGDVLDLFVLFGLGFLALFAGHVVATIGAWRGGGGAGWTGAAAATALGAALVFGSDAVHVAGLVLFGLGWVALGWLLLRARATPGAAVGA